MGLELVKIVVTDEDSGDFGKVRFMAINGPLAKKY